MWGIQTMKLTYWYSQCPDDSEAYSGTARTRRGALEHIAQMGGRILPKGSVTGSNGWHAPIKVTVEYDNALDLLQQCTNEGRMYWEAQALRSAIEGHPMTKSTLEPGKYRMALWRALWASRTLVTETGKRENQF